MEINTAFLQQSSKSYCQLKTSKVIMVTIILLTYLGTPTNNFLQNFKLLCDFTYYFFVFYYKYSIPIEILIRIRIIFQHVHAMSMYISVTRTYLLLKGTSFYKVIILQTNELLNFHDAQFFVLLLRYRCCNLCLHIHTYNIV